MVQKHSFMAVHVTQIQTQSPINLKENKLLAKHFSTQERSLFLLIPSLPSTSTFPYPLFFLTTLLFSPSTLQHVPPDLCICNFVLEQSLSVRALQEMLANTGQNSEGVSTSLHTNLLSTCRLKHMHTHLHILICCIAVTQYLHYAIQVEVSLGPKMRLEPFSC